MGTINNLGYGLASYNFILELSKNHNVIFYPTHEIYPEDLEKLRKPNVINKALKKRDEQDLIAPCIKMMPAWDLFSFVGKGKQVGFPMFEIDKFKDIEILSLKHCDEIFVCSEWNKKIILKDIPSSNIKVIPLGVDIEIFSPQKADNKDTIFLNCGMWSMRKGHDILLKCFNKAFEKSDNVKLALMCDNLFLKDNDEWKNECKNSKLGDKITIIPRQETQTDVYNIMKQTDCGVFPARAEGWNMELLEMMACGKQVIATNYSAHTEFCNKENCKLIDVENVEPANDGIFFFGFGNWASLKRQEEEQLITAMREVHNNKKENLSGIETSLKYSWKNSSSKVVQALKE